MSISSKKLILIDGYCILFRSFFALQKQYEYAGIWGFIRTLWKVIQARNPTVLVIALDTGAKTWRHNFYHRYKATRPPTPEKLLPQFKMLDELCTTLSIGSVRINGYEADDCIASSCFQYANAFDSTEIISCDKDLMQLVKNSVYFYDPFTKILYDEELVKQKIGVYPKQIQDLLALVGDTSDNIPGVKNIGNKTAISLLEKYISLNNILQNVDQLTGHREKHIKDNVEAATLSYKLASLKYCVKLPDIFSTNFVLKEDALHEFLLKYNMHSLHAIMH